MMKVLPIFLHIPRTAGTTLSTILRQQLGDGRILSLYGDDITYADIVTRGACMDPEYINNLELVRGHITFGVHEHIPRPCAYFTFLREPVARCYSLYRYIRRDPTHWAHKETMEMSFDRFLDSGITLETDNGMVRQLCGSEGPLPQNAYGSTGTSYGEISGKHFKEARHNLKNYFMVVGITDQFDGYYKMLCRTFGWPWRENYRSLNSAGGLIDQLSPEVVTKARKLNKWDTILYRAVKGAK